MKGPSIFAHIRDIILLPVTVTIVVPWFILDGSQHFIPDSVLTKLIGILVGITGVTLLLYTITLFGRFGKGTLAP